jgi:hypothetical protein
MRRRRGWRFSSHVWASLLRHCLSGHPINGSGTFIPRVNLAMGFAPEVRKLIVYGSILGCRWQVGSCKERHTRMLHHVDDFGVPLKH